MNSSKIVNSICMLGHKRIPSREGGVELVVEELATRMVKKGLSVTCLNRKGHHVSGNSFDNNEVNNHEYKGIKLKTVFAIDFKGLAAIEYYELLEHCLGSLEQVKSKGWSRTEPAPIF